MTPRDPEDVICILAALCFVFMFLAFYFFEKWIRAKKIMAVYEALWLTQVREQTNKAEQVCDLLDKAPQTSRVQ